MDEQAGAHELIDPASDPYASVSANVAGALAAARRSASATGLGTPWDHAVALLGATMMTLPDANPPTNTSDCGQHVAAALAELEAIPQNQRRLEHLLDLACVIDAQHAVQQAVRTETA